MISRHVANPKIAGAGGARAALLATAVAAGLAVPTALSITAASADERPAIQPLPANLEAIPTPVSTRAYTWL